MEMYGRLDELYMSLLDSLDCTGVLPEVCKCLRARMVALTQERDAAIAKLDCNICDWQKRAEAAEARERKLIRENLQRSQESARAAFRNANGPEPPAPAEEPMICALWSDDAERGRRVCYVSDHVELVKWYRSQIAERDCNKCVDCLIGSLRRFIARSSTREGAKS